MSSLRTFHLIIPLIICAFIGSCNSSDGPEQTDESNQQETEAQSTETDNHSEADSLVVLSDPKTQLLVNHLDSLFDLPALKKEIGFLSMGTSLPARYLEKPDSGWTNYNYGAVAGLVLRGTAPFKMSREELQEKGRFISISTFKPWSTPTERYYSNHNEIIVGFECNVFYESLGDVNFVGKTRKEITEMYGTPQLNEKDCLIYRADAHILSLHVNSDKINWVKYYRVNASTASSETVPKEFFTWASRYKESAGN